MKLVRFWAATASRSCLEKGGMGEVYLAEDQRLKRKVALKILSADVSNDATSLQRFRREAQSTASLHHANVCTIYEIGESDGQTFIAMEYCEGITLQQRIAEGPIQLEEVLDIGIQIADALEEARKKKFIAGLGMIGVGTVGGYRQNLIGSSFQFEVPESV